MYNFHHPRDKEEHMKPALWKGVLFAFTVVLSVFFASCELPAPPGANEIHYDGPFHSSFYFPSATQYIGAVRLTSTLLGPFAGRSIQKVKFYLNKKPSTLAIQVYDEGTTTTPGASVLNQPVDINALSEYAWNEVPLTANPVIGSDDIWIGLSVVVPATTTASLGRDAGPAYADGRFVYLGGSWTTLSLDGNLNIRAVTE